MIQDLSEVSPLSGRSINPYPDHYSLAFACSDIPYPLALGHALTGVRPPSLWGQWGLPRSTRVPFLKDLGPALAPAVHHLRGGKGRSPDLTANLLVMPVSLFGMLPITTTRQRFTSVGHILQPQLPTALRLAVATSPRGSAARLSGGGYSVPSASHPGVTPNARPGRVPVAEHRIFMLPDQYTCDLVSHVPGRCRRVRMAGIGVGAGGPGADGGHMQAHPTHRQAICGSGVR